MPEPTIIPSQDALAAPTVAARKEKAARFSVFASAGLALIKLIAGFTTGSLALISDAMHALIDVGATIMTWLAIRVSDKPADDNHHYGHGKIEAVVALIETALLLLLALGVAVLAVGRLSTTPEPLKETAIAFVVLGISIVVDVVRWRSLSAIARETGSTALEADALHFSSDLVSSAMVLVGLVASVLGFVHGDALAAIAVALYISITGYRLGKRAIATLVDTAPTGVGDDIQAIAAGFSGVSDVERVRVRRVGNTLFADLAIGVPRTLPPGRIIALKDALNAAIVTRHPGAEVVISANPKALDNESVLERVLVIAVNQRLPVHHVTAQEVAGRLCISLDLEVDGRMSLASAHRIASRLEAAIQDSFGPETEIETHIEPLEAHGLAGREAPQPVHDHVSGVIALLVSSIPDIGRVHHIRVRETERGLMVNLHVEADAGTTVEAVHQAVDMLERAAKEACPDIHRIVTHAEPAMPQG